MHYLIFFFCKMFGIHVYLAFKFFMFFKLITLLHIYYKLQYILQIFVKNRKNIRDLNLNNLINKYFSYIYNIYHKIFVSNAIELFYHCIFYFISAYSLLLLSLHCFFITLHFSCVE